MHFSFFRLLALAFVTFIFALGLSACGNETPTPPEPEVVFDPLIHDWPQDVSDIAVDPDTTYGKLNNGLRYILRRNSRPEGEAVIRFWIRAGSRNETEKTVGLAHYLEHMAFNGSENVPEGELVKSLERLGLSFGADTNASTTYMRTEYRLNLPNLDDETLDYGLFVMRETADKLLIEPGAVDRERGVVKAEEARGNSPGRAAQRAFTQWAYPNRRTTAYNVIGSPEILDALSADDLRTYYNRYYRPERSVMVIMGDFDVAEMQQKIEAVFGDWTNDTPAPEEPDEGKDARTGPSISVYSDKGLQSTVYLLQASPSTYGGDTVKSRQENFAKGYANAIVNKRISKKLLEDNAPVLSAGIGYSVGKIGNSASASATLKEDDWKAALDLLSFEIRQALKFGFQQAELDEVLAQSRRSVIDSKNYAAKRRTGSLAANAMNAFSGGSVLTAPQQDFDAFETNASEVTVEDLELAFLKMWANFDPIIWMQGPETFTPSVADIHAHFEQTQNSALSAPEPRETLEFAYTDFGTPGTIVQTRRVEDYDIDQFQFENNVYLNLKKTDFEDDWIRVSITIGEGWDAFPDDKPGLTSLANALPLGGFEAHPVSDLTQIFAGKRIGLGFSVGSEHLMLSGSTNPEDIADQFSVWTALLTHPGYREVWKTRYKDSLSASFHTIDSTPSGVAARDLARIWANGDRRYGMVSEEEYLSYTLEDVRNALAPAFKDGAIEIGIVGDFNPQEMIDIVAKTFGALPKRRANYTLNLKAFEKTFPDGGTQTLFHTGEANQGALYMGWPTTKIWTLERSRAYSFIARVFNNRLIDIIREDKGLSYSPSASVSFSENSSPYGYFSASITADPQFFDAFQKATSQIASDLKAGGITQDELNRARKPVLESIERSTKENGAWLSVVRASQTDPKGLDRRRSRLAAITALTPALLDEYARESFTEADLNLVKILPNPKAETTPLSGE